jgi:hypothetical protein
MMPQRIAVEFESELDDSVWDEAGNLFVPGGKLIADGIRESLRRNGIDVSPVSQRDWYGWEFTFKYGNHRILAVVQHAEKWLVALSDLRFLPSLFFRKATRSALVSIGVMIKQCIELDALGTDVDIAE